MSRPQDHIIRERDREKRIDDRQQKKFGSIVNRIRQVMESEFEDLDSNTYDKLTELHEAAMKLLKKKGA